MSLDNKRLVFIDILRAIAAMLITNSHFDGVYPINISWGGCPGVALFFTISGFLLVKSVSNIKNFFSWYGQKVIRLYIPLTLVNIVMVLIGFKAASLLLFIFPINGLWYVPAIAVLYVPFYLVVKAMEKYSIRGGYNLILILLVVIYSILYTLSKKDGFFVEGEIKFRLIYGFAAMMLGSVVYRIHDSVFLHKSRRLFSCLSLLSLVAFLAMKFFMDYSSVLIRVQFLTEVFGVSFAVLLLIGGIGYADILDKFASIGLSRFLLLISKCSLEIFLVQFIFIAYLKSIVFPINIVLICVCIILSALVIHTISEKLYSRVRKQYFLRINRNGGC
jgi:peptidoglycan/LPS O-acetylase OafA/YrhL